MKKAGSWLGTGHYREEVRREGVKKPRLAELGTRYLKEFSLNAWQGASQNVEMRLQGLDAICLGMVEPAGYSALLSGEDCLAL